MDALATSQAIEAIRQLKARYFRFMDTKAWADLPGLFTADMKVVTPEGKVWLDTGPAFAASLRTSLEHAVSVHHGFMPEITIVDADNATGLWAMHDRITWPDRHPTQGWKAIDGAGYYHETYRRGDDGAWRIATLSLTRLRLDITWPEDRPAGTEAAG